MMMMKTTMTITTTTMMMMTRIKMTLRSLGVMMGAADASLKHS